MVQPTCKILPGTSIFLEGILLVLALEFFVCGCSVIPKHPLAYNEQIISNSTPGSHLDIFSAEGEGEDEVTREAITEGSLITSEPTLEVLATLGNPSNDSAIEEEVGAELEEDDGLVYNATSGFRVSESSSGISVSAITTLCLLATIVAALVLGGVSFVLYRQRMWNRPQTLSDKCSNDESTGYIDDTFRENSEEMYSLDNDSFLNSLEAMTIQNYWTDHVKHTKL